MYKADMHTHSTASFDGHSTTAELAAAAIERGLSALCVTDHCECNDFIERGHFPPEIHYYHKEQAESNFADAKEAAGGKIKLLYGIEIAQAHERPEIYEQILAENTFDFIIASIHNLRGMTDFAFMDNFESVENCNRLLKKYMEELYETAQLRDYDTFAHIGYPLRYMHYRQGYDVSLKSFVPELSDILRTLIEKGRALELNISGLRSAHRSTFPDIDVLKLYKSLGGELVTVGTDAHRASDIGSCIDDGYKLLSEAGFKYHTVFENRKPTLHTID
ncbi:MAG: histidinol-phosphatase HisJ family protein [Clostridiales bacterium]|nr:histidinol-phosphatase HisJ family protein [Clostridiales bacterium]